jgi:hypothetical protein
MAKKVIVLEGQAIASLTYITKDMRMDIKGAQISEAMALKICKMIMEDHWNTEACAPAEQP